MLTLATADLHLTSNPRDRYRHKMMRRLVRLAAKWGVKRTLLLGDLTEEKDRHNDWLVNRIVEHVTAFAQLGEVIVLQGNHDYLNDPDMPFFRFLRHLPNVRWIGRPTSFSAEGLGRVMFLPHTRNWEADWNGLSFNEHAYVFAHGTFQDTRLGHGIRAESGIPASLFNRTRVIAGDIHIPQQVGSVTYVGAPYTIDFGDDYEARVLMLDGKNMQSIRVRGPQKRLIVFDDYERTENAKFHYAAGDILKVKVCLPHSKMDQWPQVRDNVRQWAARVECECHSVVPEIIDDSRRGKRTITNAETKSDLQVMREFAKLRGVGKTMLRYGEKKL